MDFWIIFLVCFLVWAFFKLAMSMNYEQLMPNYTNYILSVANIDFEEE